MNDSDARTETSRNCDRDCVAMQFQSFLFDSRIYGYTIQCKFPIADFIQQPNFECQ